MTETTREGQSTIRGYSRHAFSDAWSRFTPSISATPSPSLTVTALTVFGDDCAPAALRAAKAKLGSA